MYTCTVFKGYTSLLSTEHLSNDEHAIEWTQYIHNYIDTLVATLNYSLRAYIIITYVLENLFKITVLRHYTSCKLFHRFIIQLDLDHISNQLFLPNLVFIQNSAFSPSMNGTSFCTIPASLLVASPLIAFLWPVQSVWRPSLIFFVLINSAVLKNCSLTRDLYNSEVKPFLKTTTRTSFNKESGWLFDPCLW